DQVCRSGECQNPPTGAGGAGGGSNAGGAGGTSGTDGGGPLEGDGGTTGTGGTLENGGSSESGGAAEILSSRKAIGLATGGGGCRCDLAGRVPSGSALVVSMLL